MLPRISHTLALVLPLVVLGPATAADDTYTIKFKDLARGGTGSYEVSEKLDLYLQVLNTEGEPVFDRTFKGDVKMAFWERIMEKAADEPPTRRMRGYGAARVTIPGEQPVILAVEGQRVTIERKGEKTTYKIDGKQAAPASPFDSLLQQEMEENPSYSQFLPAKPVKLKQSWRIDGKALAAALSKKVQDLEFDLTKVQALGRLTEVYEKDGRRFGKLTNHIEIPIKSLTAKDKKYTLGKDDKMIIQTLYDVCIDGSAHVGTVKVIPYIGINTPLTVEGQKVTIKLVLKGERTTTFKEGLK